jgi:hypothetical protein
MLKNLATMSFFLYVIGVAFNGTDIPTKKYSHFKCLRDNRSYTTGLDRAVAACELVLKEVEDEE